MSGESYYQTLFEALCKRSLGELAKAAADILGMPVVVSDAAFIVRAKYPDVPVDDEQWDANILNRQIEQRFIKTFTDDDHYTRHAEAGGTILTNWGHYEAAPRLTCILRSKAGMVGYFAALATGVDVQPWHYEAADAIADAFSMLMDTAAGGHPGRSGSMSPELYTLLDGSFEDAPPLELLPEGFFADNRPAYLLFCVRTRNPHYAPLETYLGHELAGYFEHAVQTVHGGDLFMLASEVPEDARESVRAGLFAEALAKQSLICGASRRFDSLDDVRSHAWEARCALRVGEKLALDGPLFHYEDMIVDVVCDHIDDLFPHDALVSGPLASLQRHDRENGTEYLETMRVYLRSGLNKKVTCEQLHVHRNTLLYRLDRMRDVQGIDVNEALYSLYFALEDYRSRAGRRRLP